MLALIRSTVSVRVLVRGQTRALVHQQPHESGGDHGHRKVSCIRTEESCISKQWLVTDWLVRRYLVFTHNLFCQDCTTWDVCSGEGFKTAVGFVVWESHALLVLWNER